MDEKKPIDTSKLAAASAVAWTWTSVDPNAWNAKGGSIDFGKLSLGNEKVEAPVAKPAVVAEQLAPTEATGKHEEILASAAKIAEAPVEPVAPQEETTTSIAQLNAIQEEEKWPTIDISNIHIDEMTRKQQKKWSKKLWNSGIGRARLGARKLNYRKIFSIASAV